MQAFPAFYTEILLNFPIFYPSISQFPCSLPYFPTFVFPVPHPTENVKFYAQKIGKEIKYNIRREGKIVKMLLNFIHPVTMEEEACKQK